MHKRNRGLLRLLGALGIGLAIVAVAATIVLRTMSARDTGDTREVSGAAEEQERASGTEDGGGAVSILASLLPDLPQREPERIQSQGLEPSSEPETEPLPKPEPLPEPEPEPPPRRGYFEEIPQDVRESMAGISMPEGAKVTYDDLRYLTVYYYDFEGNHATGNIVVAQELADEVLDIFAELYDIEYPIECVKLIDEFYDKQTEELNSLDRASMGNNNTSAFCYRAMNSAGTLSQHAFGRAIDLNPKVNPYVSGSSVSPANARIYADRSGESLPEVEQRAIIRKDDEVYKIFTSRGWAWGCEIWSGVYDYQHFQKTV